MLEISERRSLVIRKSTFFFKQNPEHEVEEEEKEDGGDLSETVTQQRIQNFKRVCISMRCNDFFLTNSKLY